MNSFWLFRTNLKNFEYYHSYNDLKTFRNNCHDFYLMQGIYFLENKMFDEVIIWRLSNGNHEFVFDVNGRKFIQKFVKNFYECFKYQNPQVSFFRGGFPEYCKITKENPRFFGKKLYLGAGRRTTPEYGGIYDEILYEDERDIDLIKSKGYKNYLPFYKTVNKRIFYPKNENNRQYDICFPANFTQLKYKGQEDFIYQVSKSDYLKSLKICHVGNKPGIGKKICEKYNVKNIRFTDHISRIQLNDILNKSKIGIVNSNINDGCPRVITEVLSTGIPLVLNPNTRLLRYYKEDGGAMTYYDIEQQIKDILENYEIYNEMSKKFLEKITMKKICDLNYSLWL